jgi:hypothetical protein
MELEGGVEEMHISSGSARGGLLHVGPSGEIEGCYAGSGAEVLEQGAEECRVVSYKSSVSFPINRQCRFL